MSRSNGHTSVVPLGPDLKPLQQRFAAAQQEADELQTLRDQTVDKLRFLLEGDQWKQAAQAAQALASLTDAWAKALLRLERAEYNLQRAQAERAIAPELEHLRSERLKQLGRKYHDHGPQYDILIGRTIDAELRARASELTGLHLKPSDHRSQTLEVLACIAQLQRYTESSKTEVLDRAYADGVLAALQTAEELLSAERPELYQQLAHRIYDRAQGEEEDDDDDSR